MIDEVHARVDPAQLYAVSGLQFLPFNTLYQLAAEQRGPNWAAGAAGRAAARPAGLLADRRAADGDHQRLDHRAAGRPDPVLVGRAVRRPGPAGRPVPAAGRARARSSARVRPTVAEHDRAAGVDRPWLRSGRTTPPRRWSGCRPRTGDSRTSRPAPGPWSGSSSTSRCSTEASRAANFTNEGGVDGRVRYLRNVGGLWLLQESLRTWRRGRRAGRPGRAAGRGGAAPGRRAGGRRRRTAEFIAARRHARPDPRGLRGGRASRCPRRRPRSSAASSTRWPTRTRGRSPRPSELTGQPVDVIHIVGGGCQNALLCQLTADLVGPAGAGRSGRGDRARQPRRAGPVPRACCRRRWTSSGRRCAAASTWQRYEPAATAATVAAEVG